MRIFQENGSKTVGEGVCISLLGTEPYIILNFTINILFCYKYFSYEYVYIYVYIAPHGNSCLASDFAYKRQNFQVLSVRKICEDRIFLIKTFNEDLCDGGRVTTN